MRTFLKGRLLLEDDDEDEEAGGKGDKITARRLSPTPDAPDAAAAVLVLMLGVRLR